MLTAGGDAETGLTIARSNTRTLKGTSENADNQAFTRLFPDAPIIVPNHPIRLP